MGDHHSTNLAKKTADVAQVEEKIVYVHNPPVDLWKLLLFVSFVGMLALCLIKSTCEKMLI